MNQYHSTNLSMRLFALIICLGIVACGMQTGASVEPLATYSSTATIQQDDEDVIANTVVPSESVETEESIVYSVNAEERPLWLLFEQETTSGSTVYRLDLSKEPLTLEPIIQFDLPKIAYRYVVSPNAKYIAVREEQVLKIFEVSTGLEIARLDAGRLPTNEFATDKIDNELIWSPTGEQLAFLVEAQSLRRDIILYDLTTKQTVRLTNDVSRENALTWSPDGKQIAFAVLESCDGLLDNCDLEYVNWQIGVVDTDGLNYRVIGDETILPKSSWQDSSLCHLSWSPDGTYLAFKSFCPSDGIPNFDELFVIATDGSQTVQLTQFGNVDYVNHYSVTWSSDKRYLIIGFAHDFIFDDANDLRGYQTFEVGTWENPNEIFLSDSRTEVSRWDNQEQYVIGSLANYQYNFLAERQGNEIRTLFSNIPPISLNGVWTTSGYVTQAGENLVKIIPSTGQIINLSLHLETNMHLVGGRIIR